MKYLNAPLALVLAASAAQGQVTLTDIPFGPMGVTVTSASVDVATGAFNGPGNTDAAVIYNNPFGAISGQVEVDVLLDIAAGAPISSTIFTSLGTTPAHTNLFIDAADYTGNGEVDILIYADDGTSGIFRVLRGSASGAFVIDPTLVVFDLGTSTLGPVRELVSADMNNDMRLDVVVVREGASADTVEVWTGNPPGGGNSFLVNAYSYTSTGTNPNGPPQLALGDVFGGFLGSNGVTDVALLSGRGLSPATHASLLINTGTSLMLPPVSNQPNEYPVSLCADIALGFFDVPVAGTSADWGDVVLADAVPGFCTALAIAFGSTSGGVIPNFFAITNTPNAGPSTRTVDMVTSDMDGDGLLDYATCDDMGNACVFINSSLASTITGVPSFFGFNVFTPGPSVPMCVPLNITGGGAATAIASGQFGGGTAGVLDYVVATTTGNLRLITF